MKYGHEKIDARRTLTGGLAEHCLLAPGTPLVRLSDDLTDGIACPANCATATSAAAVWGAGPQVRGGTVLVQGAGLLGLTVCAMARMKDAAHVIVCDANARRLALAHRFGATHTAAPDQVAAVVAAVTANRGVDAALEMSGSAAAFETGLPLVRMGGVYVLVGAVFPDRPVPLVVERIVRRNLTLIGVHNYTPHDLHEGVTFLQCNRPFPFESLVERWFPLEEAEQAFRFALESGSLRVGIRP